MQIRPLQLDEWTVFRDLRLRALADSPDSFAQSLADGRARGDEYWMALTRSVTEPGGQVMFVVEEAGQPVGLAFGLLDAEAADCAHVGGMWMDPAARGRGADRALLEAVVAWAKARGCRRLELWVTEANAAAVRLYRHGGFQETGRRDVLPFEPSAPGRAHGA